MSVRITLKTYGGLAAAIVRKPLVFDTAALPEDDANRLKQLVTAVVASAPALSAEKARPDAMTYSLTIEDGQDVKTVKLRDGELTQAFDQLLQFFKKR